MQRMSGPSLLSNWLGICKGHYAEALWWGRLLGGIPGEACPAVKYPGTVRKSLVGPRALSSKTFLTGLALLYERLIDAFPSFQGESLAVMAPVWEHGLKKRAARFDMILWFISRNPNCCLASNWSVGVSTASVSAALKHNRTHYIPSLAHPSGIRPHSCDHMHWYDIQTFNKQAAETDKGARCTILGFNILKQQSRLFFSLVASTSQNSIQAFKITASLPDNVQTKSSLHPYYWYYCRSPAQSSILDHYCTLISGCVVCWELLNVLCGDISCMWPSFTVSKCIWHQTIPCDLVCVFC